MMKFRVTAQNLSRLLKLDADTDYNMTLEQNRTGTELEGLAWFDLLKLLSV